MEEKIVSSLGGVGMYGVISILIFVAFFTGTLLWTYGLKNKYLNHMGDLPLDDSEQPTIHNDNQETL